MHIVHILGHKALEILLFINYNLDRDIPFINTLS